MDSNDSNTGEVSAYSMTLAYVSYDDSLRDYYTSAYSKVVSGIPTSVFSGSEVSRVDYGGDLLFSSVVITCEYFSSTSSTSSDGLRGPAVTLDKMHVS